MPLCGFNEKMLVGLSTLLEGLYNKLSESQGEKSKKRMGVNMALCGFNEKMLKGLIAFCEGLVEHGLEFRSKKNDETIDQAIKREISDMTRLLSETHKIEDSSKRILTEGIVKYAMGFYLIMRKNGIKDYKEVIGKIGEYFHFMDDKYYSELEGKPNDMQELVKFLNEKEI